MCALFHRLRDFAAIVGMLAVSAAANAQDSAPTNIAPAPPEATVYATWPPPPVSPLPPVDQPNVAPTITPVATQTPDSSAGTQTPPSHAIPLESGSVPGIYAGSKSSDAKV